MKIGIFDSGLGGLTAVRELEIRKPNAGFVYFGDTARVPYGSRGKDVITKYAISDSRFLLSKNVDAIMIACCTVSANCIPALEDTFDVPFYGVVDPAVLAAVKAASDGNGNVLILGTSATVKSGAFEKGINALDSKIKVTSVACPLLVPLVENGRISPCDPLSNLAIKEYVAPFESQKPSAVILGCTHYPLLAPIISKYLPESKLINCSEVTIEKILGENTVDDGDKLFFVSDDKSQFTNTARLFLQREIENNIEQIDIDLI